MATIFKSGSTWRAMIRRKGSDPISKYFDSKVEAQQWARQIETQIDRGKHLTAPAQYTFSDLATAYENDKGTRNFLNLPMAKSVLTPHFGKLKLGEIDRKAILNFTTLRERDGACPSTINHNLSCLRSIITYGATALEIEDAVVEPLTKMSIATKGLMRAGRIAQSTERDRRLEPGELERLYALFQGYGEGFYKETARMWPIVLFALATTMRLGEICRLQRSDLRERDRTIIIRDRKHPTKKKGNNQRVPLLCGPLKLNGVAVDPYEILQQCPVSNVDPTRFFPYRPRAISNAWRRTVQKEIDDLHFHDLRHEAISLLFEAGLQIQEVSVLSGHTDWKNLKRYTQLKPESLHDRLTKS